MSEEKSKVDQFAGYSVRLAEAMVAGFWNQLLSPVTAKIQGTVSKNLPLLSPPPGAIMGAFLKGRISVDQFARGMGKNGINVGQIRAADVAKMVGVDVEKNIELWQAVLQDMIMYPSQGDYFSAYWRGMFGEEGTPESKKLLDEYSKVNAPSRRHWQVVEPALRSWPSLAELAAGRNRGLLVQAEYDEMVRLSSGQRKDALKLHDELRKALPGMGEIIGAYAHVLSSGNDSPLARLWDEYPEELQKWSAWFGQDWDTKIKAPPGVGIGTIKWSHLQWANHWRSPGWGLIQQMLWRIRQDNIGEWQPIAPNAVPLTVSSAREWLKHDGTPPNIREQLLAMRYIPTSVRYVKTMWQQSIVDTTFAENELKNAGNDPRTVDLIIRSWVQEKKEKEDKPKKDKEKKEADECEKQLKLSVQADIELGLIDPAEASVKLAALGIGPACVEAAHQRRIYRLKNALLTKIRALYLSGGISVENACAALCQEGFTKQASAEYLAAWTDELTLELREIGGLNVSKWFRLGLIDRATAEIRLSSLGFADVEVALLLLSSDATADRLEADALRYLAPQGRFAASSVVRLLKSTERIRKQSQQTLRRITPVSRVKKMFLDGTIQEAWARDRLTQMGELPESVDQYLSEWSAAATAKAEKAHKPKAEKHPTPENPPPLENPAAAELPSVDQSPPQ